MLKRFCLLAACSLSLVFAANAQLTDRQHEEEYNNLIRAQKPEAAYAYLTAAIAAQPTSAERYMARGRHREWIKDIDGAISDFTKAIELDKTELHAYMRRAALFWEKGKLQEALADYSAAIKIEPGQVVAHANRGGLRYELGDYAGAIADFDISVAGTPRDMSVDGYLSRGQAKYQLKDFEGAVKDLTVYIDEGVFDKEAAYQTRAWANLILGRGDAAYKDAIEVLKTTDKEKYPPRYNVIIAYFGLLSFGRVAEAERFAKEWLPKLPASEWTTTVVAYLGKMNSENNFLLLAKGNKDKLTEARTFIGMQNILSGKPAGVAHLGWVMVNGQTNFNEYYWAEAVLKRIDADKKAPIK